MIKLSFSLWFLGKRFFIHRYGKSLKTFPFWALTFFCSRKLNFGIWKGDFLSRAPQKGVNVLAIFGYVVKFEVFSEGKTRKRFSLLPGLFRKINVLVESLKIGWKEGKFSVWKFHKKRYLWISKSVWMMAIYGFCHSFFQRLFFGLNRKS